MHSTEDLVLLYDGVCGFCDRIVQVVLARDRVGSMRFAPLQGEFAKNILSRHPELRSVDSLILVKEAGKRTEHVAVRSDAVLEVAGYLGFSNYSLAVFRAVPRILRDEAYSLFARFRYRLFGRFESCRVPTPEERARFIVNVD